MANMDGATDDAQRVEGRAYTPAQLHRRRKLARAWHWGYATALTDLQRAMASLCHAYGHSDDVQAYKSDNMQATYMPWMRDDAVYSASFTLPPASTAEIAVVDENLPVDGMVAATCRVTGTRHSTTECTAIARRRCRRRSRSARQQGRSGALQEPPGTEFHDLSEELKIVVANVAQDVSDGRLNVPDEGSLGVVPVALLDSARSSVQLDCHAHGPAVHKIALYSADHAVMNTL